MVHRIRLLLTLVCLLAAPGVAFAQMDEYSIKAGYLYNFSKYVDWPDSAFSTPSAPFVICLLGDDPFEGRLNQAISGKTSGGGRPIQIEHLKSGNRQAFGDCQILFLGKSERNHAAEIVDLLRQTSILTVADFEAFAEKGGIVDLRIEGTRVKVDLNVSASLRSNLKISARLQQVANLVH